jgi:hypothetical protein
MLALELNPVPSGNIAGRVWHKSGGLTPQYGYRTRMLANQVFHRSNASVGCGTNAPGRLIQLTDA